jgi:hypothetical protein
MPAVVATIRVSIIASVIRPVVWVVVPSSVVPSIIRIAIVATIPIATISIAIATIPVAGVSLIAITTILRHITICAALRICRWSERRCNREREDAHQRQ